MVKTRMTSPSGAKTGAVSAVTAYSVVSSPVEQRVVVERELEEDLVELVMTSVVDRAPGGAP